MLCKEILCKIKFNNSTGNKAVFYPLLFAKVVFCEYFIWLCIVYRIVPTLSTVYAKFFKIFFK